MDLYVATHIFVVFSIFFDFLSEWIFKLFQVFFVCYEFFGIFFIFLIVFYHNVFIIVEWILSSLPNFWPVLQKKFFGGSAIME